MSGFSSKKLDSLIQNLVNITGKHWTIREIAKATNLSPGYLTLLRNGNRTNPSMDVILKLCRFFDVSSQELLSDDDLTPAPESDPTVHPTQLKATLELDPTLQLCAQLIRNQSAQQALELLSILLASKFDYPDKYSEAQLLKATAHMALGQFEESENIYRHYLLPVTSHRHRAQAYLIQAQVHYHKEMFSLAIQDLVKAKELAPLGEKDLLFQIHYNIGLCYKEIGEYGASIYHLEYSIQILPGFLQQLTKAHLFMGLGNTHLRQKNINAAAKYFEQAGIIYQELNEDKFLADVQHNIARLDLMGGKYESALEKFHVCMKLHQTVDDHIGIAHDLLEIATCYRGLQDWSRVHESALRAQITFENGNKKGLAARSHILLIEAVSQLEHSTENLLSSLNTVITTFEELGWNLDHARALRLKVELLQKLGQHQEALQLSIKAFDLFDESEFKSP